MFFILLVIIIIFGEWRLKSYFEAVYDFKKQKLICKDSIRLRKYHKSVLYMVTLLVHCHTSRKRIGPPMYMCYGQQYKGE